MLRSARQNRGAMLRIIMALAAAWVATAAIGQTASVATSDQARPPRIETAAFAKRERFRNLLLSPDGQRLLARVNAAGKDKLGIVDIATGKVMTLPMPPTGELAKYRWAGNDRILFSIGSAVPWYGSIAFATRLMVMDVATQSTRFVGKRNEGLEGDDILYVDPAGGWVLLQIQRTVYEYPSVYRVDLGTNAMTKVVDARDSVWEWYADESGVVRAGVGARGKRWFMLYRRGPEDKFQPIVRARIGDENAAYEALHFAYGSDDGYILSNEKTGRYALYKFNYATRETGELVFESPTNDITSMLLSDDGRGVRAAYYTDDRDRVHWFDPELKARQSEIDTALKNRENWIVSRSRDNKRMLVWTGASNDPGSYYLYMPEAGVMRRLARINDQLQPAQLAPTQYVKYAARDGLEIPAFLTLPKGRPAKGLPLIVLPHGGPYGIRDTLSYDPHVQFLANRGYAVLQPNYRGSESYGDAFYKKGEGEWGRRMQDDLDDGMDWLVKQGIADAKRVCIVGASYGGYAALWGATRNPERYRCAASLAGVSDLRRQLAYQTDFLISRRYRKDWRTIVQGAAEFDLDSVSPLKQIDRLTVPVMIAHGDADQRVPYAQSSLYAAALTKAGKPHEFHTYAGEGHDFESPDSVKGWLDRLDAFLKRHNPAD